MNCKKCGLAIHKCSSSDEYHADDRAEYMKELNGSGCIHEPAIRPTMLALDGANALMTSGDLPADVLDGEDTLPEPPRQ